MGDHICHSRARECRTYFWANLGRAISFSYQHCSDPSKVIFYLPESAILWPTMAPLLGVMTCNSLMYPLWGLLDSLVMHRVLFSLSPFPVMDDPPRWLRELYGHNDIIAVHSIIVLWTHDDNLLINYSWSTLHGTCINRKRKRLGSELQSSTFTGDMARTAIFIFRTADQWNKQKKKIWCF